MTDPAPVVLDRTTLRFCVDLARASANGIPSDRAHHDVAAGALKGFADVLEEMMAVPAETKPTPTHDVRPAKARPAEAL